MATPSQEKVNLPLPKDAAPGDKIYFRTRVGAFTFIVPANAKSGDTVLVGVPTTSTLMTPLTVLSYKVEKQPLKPDTAPKPQDERASAEDPPSTESPQPEPSNKASKTSDAASPLEHLMCPISYELPVDPVLAEDGNIYERECIEQHLANKQTSPVNNTPMGPRLIEARNISNMLQSMADAGKPDELLTAWTKAKAHANRSETLPCGETKVFANGRHARSEFNSPHRLQGRTVHFSEGLLWCRPERVEWVENDQRVIESWDNGTKTRILTQRDNGDKWAHVWDSAEQLWRVTCPNNLTFLFVRGTVLSKADVSMASMQAPMVTDIVRSEQGGCIDFPEGDFGTFFTKDVCKSKKTFRREFVASHSQHGEIHSVEKGVKVKTVFGLNVKNPADRDKIVFYDASGKLTRVDWGNQATSRDRRNTTDFYKDGQRVRTVHSNGTIDYFFQRAADSEYLHHTLLACGEIHYYSPPLSAAAQRLAPPPSDRSPLRKPSIERVEFASTHPSHGVIHIFEYDYLHETRYDECHRFAGFKDTYAGREVSASLALRNTTKCGTRRPPPAPLGQYVHNIHFKFGSGSEDALAFIKFRDSELERMQIYGMNRGDTLAETRERWLVIRENNKKRSQDAADEDAADERSAKRACVAPPEAAQQDDDCVFVKVTTLTERDAIGRANAIVLD